MNKELNFRTDGTFKIIQFTDIHYTEDGEEDACTVALIREIIHKEQPDLIVLTGDTVYGEENLTNLSKALAPITESQIPWTFLFGNHDVEFHSSHEELFEQVRKLPGCMAYEDEEAVDGTGNHTIALKDRDGKIRWVICNLDSGDYIPMKHIDGYACLTRSQIDWYLRKIQEYEAASDAFSVLTFMHMPIPEYHEVWEFEPCYGSKFDGIASPRVNTGFFAAMQEAGHAYGLFVGHDHINDFWGKLYGIVLGYGRATGYGGYGKEGFKRGARIFVLDEGKQMQAESYLRLDDGLVVREQELHMPEAERDEG